MNSLGVWLLSPEHTILPGVPSAVIVLFAVALLLSALGFARVVYFISVGYGLSVAGVAFFSFVYFRSSGNLGGLLHMLLILVYGFRLSAYLLKRERRASFQGERRENDMQYAGTRLETKLLIWVGVSALYVAMASPILFHLSSLYRETHPGSGMARIPGISPDTENIVVFIGLALGFGGLVTEWRADAQKSRAKRRAPSRFCGSGLYRVVRFPNYFGEILLWTGSWIAGIPFYSTWAAWIISLVGLVCIVLIMLGSAKRLEAKQSVRYGTDPEFTEYERSVPILIPFIPLYSLKKLRIYLG
jgi:steroid 5-alpha reductase family enzyme